MVYIEKSRHQKVTIILVKFQVQKLKIISISCSCSLWSKWILSNTYISKLLLHRYNIYILIFISWPLYKCSLLCFFLHKSTFHLYSGEYRGKCVRTNSTVKTYILHSSLNAKYMNNLSHILNTIFTNYSIDTVFTNYSKLVTFYKQYKTFHSFLQLYLIKHCHD